MLPRPQLPKAGVSEMNADLFYDLFEKKFAKAFAQESNTLPGPDELGRSEAWTKLMTKVIRRVGQHQKQEDKPQRDLYYVNCRKHKEDGNEFGGKGEVNGVD